MVVRPEFIPFVYQLVTMCLEVQKQEVFQNLMISNDSEHPLFVSWCELQKWRLIQAYGLSYTRHHNGVFRRAVARG